MHNFCACYKKNCFKPTKLTINRWKLHDFFTSYWPSSNSIYQISSFISKYFLEQCFFKSSISKTSKIWNSSCFSTKSFPKMAKCNFHGWLWGWVQLPRNILEIQSFCFSRADGTKNAMRKYIGLFSKQLHDACGFKFVWCGHI